MKRLGRWTLNILAAGSLVLCLVLLLAWTRAQFGDAVHVRCVGHSILVFGADGRAVRPAEYFFFDASINGETYQGPSGLLRLLRSGGLFGVPPVTWRFAGVEVYRSPPGNRQVYRAVVFPAAYPLAALAALPLVWGWHAVRRSRRAGQGHCLNCGYDLRATPDRCPECGHAPRPPAPPVAATESDDRAEGR